MANIRVRTAEKSNTQSGGNEDKFYRTFEVRGRSGPGTPDPSFAIMQWGSQRNGRAGGQFKASPDVNDAASVFTKKLSDGYMVVSDETFQMDDSALTKVASTKQVGTIGPELESAYFSAGASGQLQNANGGGGVQAGTVRRPRTTPKKPEQVVEEALDSSNSYFEMITEIEFLAEQVLSTMGVAATDPVAAAVRAAGFRRVQERLHASVNKVDNYLGVLTEMIEELG